MVTFRDGSFEASEDVVIHTQIESLLELLTSQVQDKVLTENKVLEIPPIGLGESLKEAPVWGIDCYTRKMIELVIKDNINDANDNEIKHFVEKLLLPSINTQNPEKAHNMTFAADYILNVSLLSLSTLKFCLTKIIIYRIIKFQIDIEILLLF